MTRLVVAVSVLVATLVMGAGPQGSSVTSVTATSTEGTTVIRVTADAPIETYQRPERTPDGYILRLPGMRVSPSVLDTSATRKPLSMKAEQIRTTAVLRLTCVKDDSIRVRREGSNQLVYTIVRSSSSTTVASDKRKDAGRWSLDVIVIDPGHGGQDAGAEGVNGVYEKDVTLSIARLLRDRLQEILPSTKVVLTRDRDVFIELFRRTQIANEAGGKLFISIHCNSMPTKPHPAHGCETYILRPGRNDDAARVASRENASVRFERSQSRYEGMTEDQIIIATMAQRSFVRLSESFAASIQKSVRTGTPLHDRGVSQAGFFVLVGASMPNVLVETGFLSNVKDADYLASSKGQRAIAASLADAVRTYASSYERSLNH